MIKECIETPQEMASYLTDNAYLQRYYEIFLTIKDDTERKAFEQMFWLEVAALPENEQAIIRASESKVPQRIYDRLGSIIASVQKRLDKRVSALQQPV